MPKFNYNPAVNANNGADYVSFNRPAEDHMTIFVVFSSNSTVSVDPDEWYNQPAIVGGQIAWVYDDYGITLNGGAVHWSHDPGNEPAVSTGGGYNNGYPHLVTTRRYIVSGNGNPDPGSMWMNGSFIGTADMEQGTWNDPAQLRLFSHPAGGGTLNGDIAEVIFYRDTLAPGPRQRVETYLALKYGLTLTNDYRDGNNNVIYSLASAFDYNIAGIGRQSSQRFNQRQSRSSNPQGIVAIGCDSVFATNAANPDSMLQDNSFFVWGDDNGPACWGSEIKAAPTPRRYLKIARNWRYTITNSGGLDTVLVQLNVDDPEFDLPGLPTTSEGLWYIFFDTDGNFNTAPVAIPMAQHPTQSNIWQVKLLPATLSGLNNYFSFGTRLGAIVSNPTYCVDSLTPIEFIGSYLGGGGDSCTVITLTAPGDTIVLNYAASITDSTYNWGGVGAGECLDTLLWIPTAAGGPYNVTVSRAINCLSPAVGDWVQQSTISTAAGNAPNIGFGSADSVYLCLGDPNRVINLISPDPGTYTLVSSTGTIGAASDLINASDFVMVHSGTVGRHVIRFTSIGCGYDDVLISIGNAYPSSFAYADSVICMGLGSYNNFVQPAVPTGGTFSCSTPGISVAANGTLNLNASTEGIYSVRYTPADSSCALPSNYDVELVEVDSAIFDYPSLIYCLNGNNPLPTITSLPSVPGGYFSVAMGVGGDSVQVDSTTGEVFLSTASGPDVYAITYTVSTPCAASRVDNVQLDTGATGSFVIPDTVCSASGAIAPGSVVSTAGYTLSWSNWTGHLDIDSVNGVIDLVNSTAGGPYPVTMHLNGGLCPDSVSTTLTILGGNSTVATYPAGPYCVGAPNISPQFTNGVTGGAFFASSGALILLANGTIDLTNSDPGTYDIFYVRPLGQCTDTVTLVTGFVLDTIPDASFTLDSTSVCETTGFADLDFVLGPGLMTVRAGTQAVSGAISNDTLLFNSLQAGNTYSITNILAGPNGCRDTATAFITILPPQDPAFAYIPATVCINGNDPTPFIQGVGGGTFAPAGIGNPNTTVDPLTGVVNLDSSGIGMHFISYTTPGPCPTSANRFIRILDGYEAFFAYDFSTICENDSFLFVDTVTVDSPGISHFYTNALNLEVDSLTGTIFTYLSGIDSTETFVVYHVTGDSSLCQDTTAVLVTIDDYDATLDLAYPRDSFCTADGIISATITATGNPVGNYTFPAGLTTLANNDIDLEYSTPGQHIVRYTLQGVCEEFDLDTLFIVTTDNATFNFGSPGICATDSTFGPAPGFAQPGVFFYDPIDQTDVLTFVNDSTGVVDVINSSPGSYEIYYRTLGYCPDTALRIITIQDIPEIDTFAIDPGLSFCMGADVEFSISGAGSYRYFVNDTLQSSFGSIFSTTTLRDNDVVTAVLTNSFGCSDSISWTVEVLPYPQVVVLSAPDVVAGSSPIDIVIGPSQNGEWINWAAIGRGRADVITPNGVTDTMMVGDSAVITNTVTLQSDYYPAELVYYFTPIVNGCTGPQDSLIILLNPSAEAIFVPEVMTPNRDNRNDTWEIRYNTDIDPALYTIDLYNRSGGHVYTMSPLVSTWDGAALPDGVYWWVLKDTEGAGVQSGGLTIRRR